MVTTTTTAKPAVVTAQLSAPLNKFGGKRFWEKKVKMTIPEYLLHPGGQTNLKLAEASMRPDILFLSYHCGLDMENKIPKMCLAKGVEMPTLSDQPFYNDIHQMVQRVKKEHPEQEYVMYAWNLFTTIALPFCYYNLFKEPSLLRAVLFAGLLITYFFNIFHMRHHKGGNLYRNELLNKITDPFYTVVDNTFGITVHKWIDRHNGGHHLHTNQTDMDPDTMVSFNLLRFLPTQPYKWFNRYQTYYVPLLMSIFTLTFPYRNVLSLNGPKWAFASYLVFFGGIPYLTQGFTGIFYVWLVNTMASTFLGYLFSISHNHPFNAHIDIEVCTMDEWLAMQIQESVSWGGYLATVFFGGINLQTEHHVLPAVDVAYYYFVMPELKKICEKRGVQYIYEPTLPHAVLRFHAWLNKMGTEVPIDNRLEAQQKATKSD